MKTPEFELPPKTRRGRRTKYRDQYHKVTRDIVRAQYYKRKRDKALEKLKAKGMETGTP